MLPYLIGAAVALAFAGYMVWESRRSTGQATRLVGLETSSVADVHALAEAAAAAAGPGSFSHRVEITGVAVPGDRGLLTSEITDTPCLWSRQKVTHHYEESYRTKEGHRRTRRQEDVVTDTWSKQEFGVRDDTGVVTVVPTARINGPRKVAGEFRQDTDRREGAEIAVGSFRMKLPATRDRDRTLGYEYEEWVLLPDTRVFVSGEAFDDRGRLEVRGPTGPDAIVISTRSEEELIAHHRGETTKQRVFAGLGALAAVVLVVLALTIG